MICIRIFRTRKEAEWAKEILKEGGIDADILEDNLYGTPIQKFGVPARFRLLVTDSDFTRAITYIAKKLKKK